MHTCADFLSRALSVSCKWDLLLFSPESQGLSLQRCSRECAHQIAIIYPAFFAHCFAPWFRSIDFDTRIYFVSLCLHFCFERHQKKWCTSKCIRLIAIRMSSTNKTVSSQWMSTKIHRNTYRHTLDWELLSHGECVFKWVNYITKYWCKLHLFHSLSSKSVPPHFGMLHVKITSMKK